MASNTNFLSITTSGSTTTTSSSSQSAAIPSLPFVGVAPTAEALMVAVSATVGAGGSSYQVGDVLILAGSGQAGTASTFTVETLSGSAVATVSERTYGALTALGTNPVATTGGNGSGCTLNVTYRVGSASVTSGGNLLMSAPAVVFSSGSAAATAVVVGGVLTSLLVTSSGSYTTLPTISFTGGGQVARRIRVVCGNGSSAYIKFGASGLTCTSSDILITDRPEYFEVGGITNFAVLQNASAAVINVVPINW